MTLKKPSLHVFTFYIYNFVCYFSLINGVTTEPIMLKSLFSVILENKSV